MSSFADRPALLKGNRKVAANPQPSELDRWEDTDPDTWPAEWADVPIPFVLTGKGVVSADTPRGQSRRNVLGLIAGAASGLILGRGRAGAAATLGQALRLSQCTPGPLALAYRDVQRASAECRRLSKLRPTDQEAVSAFERRLGVAIRREAEAERVLVALIAQRAGFALERPDPEADLFSAQQHRPVAVAIEGRAAYLLVVADAGSIGCPDPSGVPSGFWFRPVVVDLGGLA